MTLLLLVAPIHADTSSDLTVQGTTLLSQGHFSQAISTFDAALAAEPHNLQARVGKGMALSSSGRMSESRLQFTIALSENPSYLPALLERGKVELATGNAREALESYLQALTQDPGNHNAIEGKGDALLALGKRGEAIGAWSEALCRDPDNGRLQEKITSARGNGETETFLWIGSIAVVILSISALSWDMLKSQRKVLSGLNGPDGPFDLKRVEPSSSCAAPTPSPPADLPSRHRGGDDPFPGWKRHCIRIRGMFKGTMLKSRPFTGMDCTSTSTTPIPGGDPSSCVSPGINLPDIHVPDLDTDDSMNPVPPPDPVIESVRSLQVLLNSSDYKYPGDGLKGILHYSNREYESAIREFDKEIAYYQDRTGIAILKVRALMHLHRFSEALELDRLILRDAPDTYEAITLGAQLADILGQTEFALQACNRATALRHNSPVMWTLKGRLFLKAGRYAESLAALQQSLALDGESEQTWKEYGDFLIMTEQYPLALQAFEMVLVLGGDNPWIQARIETCQKMVNPSDEKEYMLSNNTEKTFNSGNLRVITTGEGNPHESRYPDTGRFSLYNPPSPVRRSYPAEHDRHPGDTGVDTGE